MSVIIEVFCRTNIEGHENNLHCVSTAITGLSSCVYTNLGNVHTNHNVQCTRNVQCIHCHYTWTNVVYNTVRSGIEKEPLQVILKERMREFVEKLSERMLKLQLEDDKELQKEIKQRDSLYVILEKMVKNLICFYSVWLNLNWKCLICLHSRYMIRTT